MSMWREGYDEKAEVWTTRRRRHESDEQINNKTGGTTIERDRDRERIRWEHREEKVGP